MAILTRRDSSALPSATAGTVLEGWEDVGITNYSLPLADTCRALWMQSEIPRKALN